MLADPTQKKMYKHGKAYSPPTSRQNCIYHQTYQSYNQTNSIHAYKDHAILKHRTCPKCSCCCYIHLSL